MRWTDTAKKFLGAFASKDFTTIESLLDENVRLINWSCDVKGIGDTINALENFFDFVKDIKIHKQKLAPSIEMLNVTSFQCNMNEKN